MTSLRERLAQVAQPKTCKVTDELFVLRYGDVWVRELSGTERRVVDESINNNASFFSEEGWKGRMAAIYLCSEAGDRLYSLDESAELDSLANYFLDIVIAAGHRISGIGDDAMEEARKNSTASQD